MQNISLCPKYSVWGDDIFKKQKNYETKEWTGCAHSFVSVCSSIPETNL